MSAARSCTMMNCQAPACTAEAFACCAHSANRNIALFVDAIVFVASILISLRLPALAIIMVLGLLVLVLKSRTESFQDVSRAEH